MQSFQNRYRHRSGSTRGVGKTAFGRIGAKQVLIPHLAWATFVAYVFFFKTDAGPCRTKRHPVRCLKKMTFGNMGLKSVPAPPPHRPPSCHQLFCQNRCRPVLVQKQQGKNCLKKHFRVNCVKTGFHVAFQPTASLRLSIFKKTGAGIQLAKLGREKNATRPLGRKFGPKRLPGRPPLYDYRFLKKPMLAWKWRGLGRKKTATGPSGEKMGPKAGRSLTPWVANSRPKGTPPGGHFGGTEP